MPRRIAISNLNASTIDIINTIRANASAEYQASVPAVETEHDIPRVGEIIYGTPAFANQFVNALVNQIALIRVKSATFNNAYANLKKGYLEFGETVEEVFVGIAKAREFSAEKAAAREFKRSLADVRSAFHAINWKVQYPVSVQDEELRQAFLSITGVQDLIAQIVNSVMRGAEYDEYLLFKYLIIKAIAHGKMYPVSIGDGTDLDKAAVQFRGVSNDLTFLKTKYNISGVHTNTAKADQCIFMDSFFDAAFDVEVLSSAFNMSKAEYMGQRYLIDDFTTFDNERFSIITEDTDMIEEVTSAELALMANVKACIVDKEWFQVYDNLTRMTETPVSSGMYWNYFYNVWKTVSTSPFSNAVVFVTSSADTDLPEEITVEVTGKSVNENATVLTLETDFEGAGVYPQEVEFVQTKDATEEGIAVHKFGAYIFPANADDIVPEIKLHGVTYVPETDAITGQAKLGTSVDVGDTFTFVVPDAT